MKKIKLYYFSGHNFGDELNKYIFEKCFGLEIEHANLWEADFIGIGSILDRTLLQVRDIFPYILNKISNNNKTLYVLSSGIPRELDYYKNKARFFKSAFLKRNLKLISLRGYLTYKQMINMCNEKNIKNCCFGDLGLLADMLAPDIPIEPVYDMGICPHFEDKNSEIILRIHKENPNSIILDTSDNPIEYIKKIKKCKTILSTGLHPLVVADSLGIPNLWGRISELPTIFKYKDYYSIFDMDVEPFYLKDRSITPSFIINNYKVDSNKVKLVKENLYNTHKDFFSDIVPVMTMRGGVIS